LANGTGDNENEGRLEVRIAGIWTGVCNTSWGQVEADIACRQLGYSGALIADNDDVSNETEWWYYSSWLDNVTCTGDELYIWDCDHSGPGYYYCSYSEYVYLVCQPTAISM